MRIYCADYLPMRRFTSPMQCIPNIRCARLMAGSRRVQIPRSGPPAGRRRVNIHGALCLENFDAPFVEVIKINGDSSVALLKKIEARNRDKKTIRVIRDNASYHKCEQLRQWLSRSACRIHLIHLIHLIQLPVYCPHLNPIERPIERLWGVMHEHVTHNKFYETQTKFANAILVFFRQTIPDKSPVLCDKVTDNFRIISHQNFRVLE